MSEIIEGGPSAPLRKLPTGSGFPPRSRVGSRKPREAAFVALPQPVSSLQGLLFNCHGSCRSRRPTPFSGTSRQLPLSSQRAHRKQTAASSSALQPAKRVLTPAGRKEAHGGLFGAVGEARRFVRKLAPAMTAILWTASHFRLL